MFMISSTNVDLSSALADRAVVAHPVVAFQRLLPDANLSRPVQNQDDVQDIPIPGAGDGWSGVQLQVKGSLT